VNGRYQIRRAIRDMCTFAGQNVCEDPPFSHIDLISCRNVLIYLGPRLKKRCIPIFHYALTRDGYLLLGTSESVGGFADLFALVDKKHKIYAKKATTLRPTLDFHPTDLTMVEPVKTIPRPPERAPASSCKNKLIASFWRVTHQTR
jgi:two-component system CheB/CheR fusion protein